jgi:hypothetical protein
MSSKNLGPQNSRSQKGEMKKVPCCGTWDLFAPAIGCSPFGILCETGSVKVKFLYASDDWVNTDWLHLQVGVGLRQFLYCASELLHPSLTWKPVAQFCLYRACLQIDPALCIYEGSKIIM